MATPPASLLLWQITTGHFLSRCLHVVAELGVADRLGDAPASAASIATALGLDADALERMLRLLAVAGVFEARGSLWAHTELSRMLRSDHPQSMRAFARMIGARVNWSALGEAEHTARTGMAAIEKIVPGGLWTYFGAHADEGRIFDAAMTAKSSVEIAALMPAFDFSRYRVVADVGGGRGHILKAVLGATPGASGILFDRPSVVAQVAPSERMTTRAGDFFVDALPSADAYILSNVLHDWADPQAEGILHNVRRSAPSHAELLVLESPLPEGPEPHHAKVLDIVMLFITGGRERTRAQYAALFAAAGFRLDRVVPTAGPVSVIVGVPA
jgi:hypothetical protein